MTSHSHSKEATSGPKLQHSASGGSARSRKLVSSPSHSDGEADLTIMYDGTMLLKFGRKGQAHERLFRLTQDNRYIVWKSNIFAFKKAEDSRVDLETVSRIQHGQMTANFERFKAHFGRAETNSFSIIYEGDRTLDLIAPSYDIFEAWFNGIKYLLRKIRENRETTTADKRYLKAKWDAADINGDNSLTRREVIELVASMNINKPVSVIKSIYNSVDADRSGSLNFQEFCVFMDRIRRRPELEFLWWTIICGEALANGGQSVWSTLASEDFNDAGNPNLALYFDSTNSTIDINKFVTFWENMQEEKLTTQEATNMIAKAMEGNFNASQPMLSYAGFVNIMNDTNAFMTNKLTLYQDMNRPLSYYFMASSHNTYLEGDQLASASSVNRYINDLVKGCRCVELDCWDGEDGEPIIFHGHTLTKKILFKGKCPLFTMLMSLDVIEAIRDFGFQTTPYPIVLSIENHCSLPQQQRLAETMRILLGNMLLYPGTMLGTHLPTLEQLKFKVLVKGKRLSGANVPEDTTDPADDSDEDDKLAYGAAPPAPTDSTPKTAPTKKKSSLAAQHGTHEKVHPDLSAITYLGTGKVKSFNTSSNIPPDMMSSFGESKTIKYLKSEEVTKNWIKHNEKHLSRIYPKGTRVDSSNLDPVGPWEAGNQLVALNYQTPGVSMQLNHGKFMENGNSGYVLKPEYMLRDNVAPIRNIRYTIRVISGRRLPKPGGASRGEVIDPYVQVTLHEPRGTTHYRTRTISDNGYNPVWNESFPYDVSKPEVSYFHFQVMDADLDADDFVAYAVIPVTCLEKGLRVVHLFDYNGKQEGDFAFASLLIRVTTENI